MLSRFLFLSAAAAIAFAQEDTARRIMPEVNFLRDGAGKVNGMRLGGNRVAGVRFVRR